MNVSIAYLSVVLIWSTTPLGIIWSSETVNPMMAVFLRMFLAMIIGTLFLVVMRIHIPTTKQAMKLYSYSTIGVFGGMFWGYMASRYVSSGLMSLIFGLAPIISGLMAQKILNEPKFTPLRWFAFSVSLFGLAIVAWHNISTGSSELIGIAFVLLGVFFFSLSAVMVKSVHINIHPFATTLGALYFSVPLFFMCWLLLDGEINIAQWSAKSIGAIIYMGIFASLIGFLGYFYILQKLNATTVALVTLMTPPLAITLGTLINDEPVGPNLFIGALFVIIGLTLYQVGGRRIKAKQLE
ncbi:membrane protein [Psychromonas marina]|uniref:Membrane protein n=1 Tax=Psychromonas marina TaxID=88364 RepID=A0ABQ6E399_9GAMM|nr:DMT family transporter [Psychromonas marina]GLS91893.1 membrane protein [Psychromonas marina]